MPWSPLLSHQPGPSEYPAYAKIYMSHIPAGSSLPDILRTNQDAVASCVSTLPEACLGFRTSPDKWTINEIVSHLSDDERVYVYRALRFARADSTELPGFEQNGFVQHGRANRRTVEDLLEEFSSVRSATLTFFRSLDDESLMRTGVADGNRYTVRGLGFHLAGHAMHHLDLIQRVYAPAAMKAHPAQ